MHLSCSSSPDQEFRTPSNDWYCIYRAIIFDSWLLWSDALPEDPALREHLDQDVFDNIVGLAKRIHSFHHSLPDYKKLTGSPFTVPSWWDPTNEDLGWKTGRICLFSIEGYTSDELLDLIPKRNQLKLKRISKNYVEASLASLSSFMKASESSKMLPV
jgi:hypothetical protein